MIDLSPCKAQVVIHHLQSTDGHLLAAVHPFQLTSPTHLQTQRALPSPLYHSHIRATTDLCVNPVTSSASLFSWMKFEISKRSSQKLLRLFPKKLGWKMTCPASTIHNHPNELSLWAAINQICSLVVQRTAALSIAMRTTHGHLNEVQAQSHSLKKTLL